MINLKIKNVNSSKLKKLRDSTAHLSICYDTYKMAMRHYNGAVPENEEEEDFIYQEKSYLRKQMHKVEEDVFKCLAETYKDEKTKKALKEVKNIVTEREKILTRLLKKFFGFNGVYTLS